MARSTSGMDRNGQIAALLRDFAAIQKSKQSMWGYKRAAAAILALEEPIESLLSRRHAPQDSEHRPFVDANHPRGAADRDVADHRSAPSPRAARPATSSAVAACAITS